MSESSQRFVSADLGPVVASRAPAGWNLSVFADELGPDLDEQLGEVSLSGLLSFDLRSVFGKNVIDLTPEDTQRVNDVAQRYGLSVHAIGSPVNKRPYDPAVRQIELDKLERAARTAHACNARKIRIFTPFVNNRGPDLEMVSDWLTDQIAVARDYDVILIHENDGEAFGAYPENARRLFERHGSEHFRAVFDFGNSVAIGHPPLPEWFPWLIPYLDSLHIKDALEGPTFSSVPAGRGGSGMKEILALLRNSGWKGTLTIEPHLGYLGEREGLTRIEQYRLAFGSLNSILEEL